MNTTILIVDDSKTDMMLIKNMLFDYNLLLACDGLEALGIIDTNHNIDLMILDLNMPRMNGFDVLEAMQKGPVAKRIPTMILTNYDEIENEVKGLNMGAVDYIRKPLNMQSVRKRVEIHMNLRRALKSIEEHNQLLEEKVYARTRELIMTRDITIHALLGLLEVRNLESSNHTVRTQWMMKILCEHLKSKARYANLLKEEYITELVQTAPLHDIGKVGVPDNILLKPGAFNPEEYELMKKHTTYGVEALSVGPKLGRTAGFIHTAIEIVATHHEKYDGTGYPSGVKGEDIPLSGRLMAIIDVYDALTNKRVYKDACSHEEALGIMRQERNKHFDPELLDAFFEIESDIRQIAGKYIQRHDKEG